MKLVVQIPCLNEEENLPSVLSQIPKKIKGIDKIEDEIDRDLLAGFRLKTKDILVKASLKDTLIKLKNKIYGYN